MEQKENESKINCLIRITKNELSRDKFNNDLERKAATMPFPVNEFAFNSLGIQLLRRYLWLVTKLSALYVAKGCGLIYSKVSAPRKDDK